ncbi:MAG: DUF167 domain-containing protein [Candidatus Liberibacter ctenarytainae]|uniref:UPF0235 protein EU981_04785 n=1 Tax=Candidatus Liberibacter ctenarytainae TaxID=2020335 RepID=A0A937DHF3_9HYPH|nr:DUF167 domain-containing protein [Candidatus Liberibacter ctenarytainae]
MCNMTIHLLPNAKQSEIVSLQILHNGTIHIKMKVHAPPLKGKANKSMIEILAKKLSIKKSSITLLSKQSSPIKRIYVDKDYEEIIQLLKNSHMITL